MSERLEARKRLNKAAPQQGKSGDLGTSKPPLDFPLTPVLDRFAKDGRVNAASINITPAAFRRNALGYLPTPALNSGTAASQAVNSMVSNKGSGTSSNNSGKVHASASDAAAKQPQQQPGVQSPATVPRPNAGVSSSFGSGSHLQAVVGSTVGRSAFPSAFAKDEFTEEFSGVRVRNRCVSSTDMKDMLNGTSKGRISSEMSWQSERAFPCLSWIPIPLGSRKESHQLRSPANF